MSIAVRPFFNTMIFGAFMTCSVSSWAISQSSVVTGQSVLLTEANSSYSVDFSKVRYAIVKKAYRGGPLGFGGSYKIDLELPSKEVKTIEHENDMFPEILLTAGCNSDGYCVGDSVAVREFYQSRFVWENRSNDGNFATVGKIVGIQHQNDNGIHKAGVVVAFNNYKIGGSLNPVFEITNNLFYGKPTRLANAEIKVKFWSEYRNEIMEGSIIARERAGSENKSDFIFIEVPQTNEILGIGADGRRGYQNIVLRTHNQHSEFERGDTVYVSLYDISSDEERFSVRRHYGEHLERESKNSFREVKVIHANDNFSVVELRGQNFEGELVTRNQALSNNKLGVAEGCVSEIGQLVGQVCVGSSFYDSRRRQNGVIKAILPAEYEDQYFPVSERQSSQSVVIEVERANGYMGFLWSIPVSLLEKKK